MNVNVHVQIFLKILLTNFIVSLSYLIGDRKTVKKKTVKNFKKYTSCSAVFYLEVMLKNSIWENIFLFFYHILTSYYYW